MDFVYLEKDGQTPIHKILEENNRLKCKMSKLRRLVASLALGIIAGEESAIQDDLTLIEEVLTND